MRSLRFATRLSGVLLGVLLCAPAAMAQAQGGGGQSPPSGGGGGTGGGGGGSRSPAPSVPSQPGQSQQPGGMERQSSFPEFRRPVFLSGKVVMEDGSPLPPNEVIERVCNGNPRPEGYVDSKGRFSVQLGQNVGVMMDASVSSNPDFLTGGSSSSMGNVGNVGGTMPGGQGLTERDLMGCELRATLAGYRSDVVQLSGRRLIDNPDVGVIIMRRLVNAPGTTVSFTSMSAPKDAKKAYEKAMKEAGKKNFDQAMVQLEQSVTIYPQYADAWTAMGRLHQAQNSPDKAREAYNKAIEIDPKFINPYLQLAQMAAAERKWGDVLQITDKIIKLNPYDFAGAYFYNAVANINLNNMDAAEKSAREALKLDPQHRIPKTEHLLGFILAHKRDYAGAEQHFKAYLQFAPNAPDSQTVKLQLEEVQQALARAGGTPVQPQPQQ